MVKLYFHVVLMNWLCGAVVIKAPCPGFKPVENFDFEKYAKGTWYEVARYSNEVEKQGDCGATVVTYSNERYLFTLTEVLDGKLNVIKYNVIPAPKKTGIFFAHALSKEVDEVNHTIPVHIVAVDYDKYAIGFECIYFEETKLNHEYAWIQSRKKILEGSAKDAVFDFIKSSGYMDINRFVWDHFGEESCQVID